MSFTDKIEIEVKAGKGGDGKLSFRHEKYMAKGGPDGGDGGYGGSVVFQVDHNLNTLAHFRNQKLVKAEAGQTGGTNTMHGRKGEDNVIKVPVGTMVFVEDEKIADLTQEGQTQIVAKGGRGGYGNAHFTASNRQVPTITELGEPGEYKRVVIELKLVADIGLIGLPNAGKSTLLSVISNAKPEIADYPFTTLIPNLGVTEIDNFTVLVADIPGLIEGASQGKGLGDDFLRHVERTAVLIHLIDATSADPVKDWEVINRELKDYQTDLTNKPQLVTLSKIETIDAGEVESKRKLLEKATGSKVFAISAVAHKKLDELMRAALPLVKQARVQQAAEQAEAAIPVIGIEDVEIPWQITKEADDYRVSGGKIDRFGLRTDFQNEAAVARLRDIMKKMGIAKKLERAGIESGDKVWIGESSLEWL